MENNDIYIITAQTNMHVSSGDINFGVIDNLIQRDTIFDLPNINSSSLKGALRAFFKQNATPEFVKKAFGSEAKASQDEMLQGSYRFFEANLLSIPVRSDKMPFFIATCPRVIKDLLERAKLFGCNIEYQSLLETLSKLAVEKNQPLVFEKTYDDATIEDLSFKAVYKEGVDLDPLKVIFGEHKLVLLHNDDFKTLCANENLPVVSRNNIENGESKNLWYEQVLPRYSQFYFAVMKNDKELLFDEKLNEKLVQIGANATIGYGYTTIKKITTPKAKTK